MDLSKIVLNEKIPNYRRLCELIGEKVKTGNAKKAQLKDLERYLRLEKIGNAFYVREIYEQPIKRVDKRLKYSEYIQKLILDMLAKDNEVRSYNSKILTAGKFFELICMVNENYSFCKDYHRELSEALDVEDSSIFEFYMASYPRLKQTLESGLKTLENKCLIHWKNIIMISIYEDEENVCRIADSDEVILIIKCQRKVLDDMGYKNKGQVLLARKWKEFQDRVNELVQEKSNIYFFFNAYEVLFSDDIIKERQYLEFLLVKEELELNQIKLNTLISDSISKSAKNKLDKNEERTKVKFGKAKKDVLIDFERSKVYMEDIGKIIKALISLERNNLRNEVVSIRHRRNKKK